MGNRWNRYGFLLHNVSLILFGILSLQTCECLSVNLEAGVLLKFPSDVDVDPYKALKNSSPDDSDPCNWTGVKCVDGKAEPLFKLKRISAVKRRPDNYEISSPCFQAPCGDANIQSSMKFFIHRKLLQETYNLPATPVNNSIHRGTVPVPSTGSGSFLAFPKTDTMNLREHSSDVLRDYYFPSFIATNKPFVLDPSGHINQTITSEKSRNWICIIFLLATLLTCGAIISSILHHIQGGSAMAPWKIGISGYMRRALISGATKLNRLELEVACEDFSNIINTCPECIVFKGTLSSGTEIAVVSTVIASGRDWSRHSEMRFRAKIAALSKINHKNFVNLLGYCSEGKPFTRMLVYEYASNGTLFEHLHVKEFEHLDWACRMRVVMGIAYCLQFMHHEVFPPVTIPELQSNSIYLTDDYAAKIFDASEWEEITANRSKSADHGLAPSGTPDTCLGRNVYSFGILLLEIISGKLSYSEEQDSISHWATEFLNDKHCFKRLVDPSLKSFRYNELEAVCEVIRECLRRYPEDRPTMEEVAARLRDASGVSPDAAAPRISPLWWAELEILSVEAN